MPETDRIQQYFFFGLFTVVFALNALVFFPYLGALIFAATFAAIFMPWHRFILRRIPALPNIAAFITIFTVLLAIIIPLFLIGTVVVDQAQGLYSSITSNSELEEVLNGLVLIAREKVSGLPLDQVIAGIGEYIRLPLQYLIGNVGSLFSGATDATIHIFLVLLAMFFFLRDGDKLKEIIFQLSPLQNSDDNLVLTSFEKTINSIVKGSLLVALIQGTIAGIGLMIFGVPNFALWGAIAVITSLVPGIGNTLVTIPAVIYLFANQATTPAVGMAIWAFGVSLVDNMLRPKFISSGLGVHPLLVFLSVLGGLSVFGMYGFLIGPLLLSFLFALTNLYKRAFK